MEIERTKIKLVQHRICPLCNKAFDSSFSDSVCPDDATLLCPVRDSLIDSTIGNYKIIKSIGEGGSGQVYLAQHANLNRMAAVKVLQCQLTGDPEAVKRFQLEAQAVCELNHPNITAIYDYGLLPDGRPYIAMEYIDGETLAQRLSRSPLTLEQAKQLFANVCDAMHLAHSKGILHRDLKPGNLMIDGQGKVKIVDFGLAKIVEPEKTSSITRTGTLVGTPAYMSPEQCFGRAIDARSDIYSLGCVMYESITGRPVFKAESPFEAMHKHTNEQPRPLSDFVKTIDAHVNDLTMRCLQKDPDKRFATMQQLKSALEGKISVPSIKRKARAPLGAALAGIVLLAALGIGWQQLGQQRQESTTEPPVNDPVPVNLPAVTPPSGAITALRAQFEEIESAIKEKRATGDLVGAAADEQKLNEFKAMLKGNYPAPPYRGPEVQMVGVYEGYGRLPGFENSSIGGKVNVNITYTSNPVVLILASYEKVKWQVTLAPGVKLQKVILSSYYKSKIVGVPANVPVVSSSYDHGNEGITFDRKGETPYEWGTNAHKSFGNDVQSQLGSELIAMQGAYNPGSERPFELGPGSEDWRAQHIMWRMHDFYKKMTAKRVGDINSILQKTPFYGGWVDQQSTMIGQMTAMGPIESTMRRTDLPGCTAAYDQARNTWYMVNDHNAYKLKPDGKTGENLEPPDEVPRFSWLSGITYDTKRKRIQLVSFHVEACLYTFDPGTGKWGATSLHHLEGSGLTYSASDDSLYTIEEDYNTGSFNLLKMSPEGAIKKRIPIDRPVPSRSSGPRLVQLSDAGKYIVAWFMTDMGSPEGPVGIAIGKETGKVVHVTNLPPPPDPFEHH